MLASLSTSWSIYYFFHCRACKTIKTTNLSPGTLATLVRHDSCGAFRYALSHHSLLLCERSDKQVIDVGCELLIYPSRKYNKSSAARKSWEIHRRTELSSQMINCSFQNRKSAELWSKTRPTYHPKFDFHSARHPFHYYDANHQLFISNTSYERTCPHPTNPT